MLPPLPIAPDEHDKMYIVTVPWFGKVKTLMLPYGEPWGGGLDIISGSSGRALGASTQQP